MWTSFVLRSTLRMMHNPPPPPPPPPHTHTHVHMALVGYFIVFSFVTKPGQTLEFLLWGTIVPLNFLVGYYCSIVASTPQPMAYASTHTHKLVNTGKRGPPTLFLFCLFSQHLSYVLYTFGKRGPFSNWGPYCKHLQSGDLSLFSHCLFQRCPHWFLYTNINREIPPQPGTIYCPFIVKVPGLNTYTNAHTHIVRTIVPSFSKEFPCGGPIGMWGTTIVLILSLFLQGTRKQRETCGVPFLNTTTTQMASFTHLPIRGHPHL